MNQVVVHDQDSKTGVCTVDILDMKGSCINDKFIKNDKLKVNSKEVL